jgi:hypothetical protein
MEENGLATVVLNPTWEFHNEVGIPRSAAIEYPYGRPVGQVNDAAGQRRIILDTLAMLEDVKTPGEIRHLPYIWPEDPRDTDWHPPEISPLIKANLSVIKKMQT